MSYEKLGEYIARMTDEQLKADVTVHFGPHDEYYKVDHAELTNDNEEDRLDDGHPVLIVLGEQK